MSYLFYKLKFNQYFLNIEGIQAFANRCITKYVSKAAVKRANRLTMHVTVTKEERGKCRVELLSCEQSDRMDDGSFVIKRKKSKGQKLIVYFAILFEIFLNYVSTLIFIQGEGLLFVLVRWGLAIILTLAAMLSTDAFLRNLLPEDSVRVKGTGSQNEDFEIYKRNAKKKRVIGLIVSSICLIFFEIAIIGVSRKRAIDIEGGNITDILYYGFILLSMGLPIIAGYFKWDSEQHGKLYQNTLNYYKTRKLVHSLELIVTANMKDVKSVVENSIRNAWDIFSRFKIYKENYNRKNNIEKENLDIHYSRDAESFKNKALSYFGNEVIEILNDLERNKK